MIAGNHRGAVIGVKALLLRQKGESLERQLQRGSRCTTHVMRGAKAKDAFPEFIARKGKGAGLMAIKLQTPRRVAYITLNNPRQGEHLRQGDVGRCSAAWISMWEDRDIRCAILTGAGDRLRRPRPGAAQEAAKEEGAQAAAYAAHLLAARRHGARPEDRRGRPFRRSLSTGVEAGDRRVAAPFGAGLYVLLSSTDIRIASAEHARFRFSLLSQGWIGHGSAAC